MKTCIQLQLTEWGWTWRPWTLALAGRGQGPCGTGQAAGGTCCRCPAQWRCTSPGPHQRSCDSPSWATQVAACRVWWPEWVATLSGAIAPWSNTTTTESWSESVSIWSNCSLEQHSYNRVMVWVSLYPEQLLLGATQLQQSHGLSQSLSGATAPWSNTATT